MSKKKPAPTFYIRLVGKGVTPEAISFRIVSRAISAVQDLASGRDPLEQAFVPPDKEIVLVEVRRGSALYGCYARSPDEARANLHRFGELLSETVDVAAASEQVSSAMRPLDVLSRIARKLDCTIEIIPAERGQDPIAEVTKDAYRRIAGRLFVRGDTTVVGRVMRVGGKTRMRCQLQVPGRRHLLYCDVEGKELARRLGQQLYDTVAATGSATWLHRSWHLHRFTVRDFTQPRIGDVDQMLNELRDAGLSAWDSIENPSEYIRELRS